MGEAVHAKCSCQECGTHIEFPIEAAGTQVACPACQQTTMLLVESVETPQESTTTPQLSHEDLLSAFMAPVPRTRVSFFYQLGLLFVTLTMIVLPVIYLLIIAAACWGVYSWATHALGLFGVSGGLYVRLFMLALYIAPLFAGVVMVFFMIKPLLAGRAPHAQPLALNPGAEPLLFAFVTKLCQTVGAPVPARIDVDCQLNAAASFRRGAFSFLGNDLVLTIGLPLVAGLNLREFAGVLAHEFGHFTQGMGMRLSYVVRSINRWFARVAYERDAWDVWLVELAENNEDGRIGLVVMVAQFAVWCSRLWLKTLMYLGHLIGCFLLRQMEYDADSYEIRLAGSEAFESTMRRVHVLGHVLGKSYKDMRVPWNINKRLPDNFPAYLLQHDAELKLEQRTKYGDTMGLEPSGPFDTHPSNGDRIRRARQAAEPGVFHLELPARCLFSDFEVISRQVTLLHYNDDLALPLELAHLVPVSAESGLANVREESAPSTPERGPRRIKLRAKG